MSPLQALDGLCVSVQPTAFKLEVLKSCRPLVVFSEVFFQLKGLGESVAC